MEIRQEVLYDNNYIFQRRVVYVEYSHVNADTLQEARHKVMLGDVVDTELGDWYDYYDEEFEFVESTETEQDPLVKMVKDYTIPIQLDIFGKTDYPKEYFDNG